MVRGFLLLALAASPMMAQSFDATHGVDAAGYQKWFDRVTKEGFRPIYVIGYSAGGTAQYAGVAVKDAKQLVWSAHHALTADDYQKAFDAATKKGLRPASLSGYLDGGVVRFAAIFVTDTRKEAWEARHNLTVAEYQERVTALAKTGLRPEQVTGYGDGAGGYRFAALFVAAGKTAWEAKHDLTADGYQKMFDDLSPKGFRPVSATAYPTKDGLRFAAVFVKDNRGWLAKHDLTGDGYQAEFNKHAKNGYRPLIVAGYPGGPASDLTFESAMKKFMDERAIPGGTLAVAKDGKVILTKAYGFADAGKTRAVQADDPFRLASVTKPITAAAVRKLIAEGKLKADAKAFPLLGFKPFAGQKEDARLNDITIKHLLDHRGGWDRDTAFDPMFRPLEIAKAAGKEAPAGPEDVIRYMLGQPLQFDPGAKYVYSNFGYCVLGRVIEKVTGKTYTQYVQESIGKPLGITSLELGRTLPELRNSKEPTYFDPFKGRNVMKPSSTVLVPAPDGIFHLEAMDAHGGLIASAPDLLRFLRAYWISGEPRQGGTGSGTHFGSLPGTWTMVLQTPNGYDVATLFNQRTDPSKKKYEEIQTLMKAAAGGGGAMRYLTVFVKE